MAGQVEHLVELALLAGAVAEEDGGDVALVPSSWAAMAAPAAMGSPAPTMPSAPNMPMLKSAMCMEPPLPLQ